MPSCMYYIIPTYNFSLLTLKRLLRRRSVDISGEVRAERQPGRQPRERGRSVVGQRDDIRGRLAHLDLQTQRVSPTEE